MLNTSSNQCTMLNVHDIDKTLGNLFNGNGMRSIVNPNWKRPTNSRDHIIITYNESLLLIDYKINYIV